MLLSVVPHAFVYATVPPVESALAFAFVVFELADVAFAIFPLKFSMAMHLVFQPVSFESLAVWPNILADT
jgi:hypothetical protein